MISASILAVGLLGLAAIFPVAYLNVDSGGKQTEASALSQSFIEELRTIGLTNFDGMVVNFDGNNPAEGFNNMTTANCGINNICINLRTTLIFANGGQLAQGVGTVTMTCRDGAGVEAPNQPPGNDDCTGGSQPTWIATVNVTVNWNDLRGARTVTLTTRMLRP